MPTVEPKLGEKYRVGAMKVTVYKLDDDRPTAWLKMESGGMLRLPIEMLTPLDQADAEKLQPAR